MGLRNISAWSIRNPIIPIVFFTGLLLAGMLSFSRMDVVNNPDIDFPAASVTVVQPGAAPTEIENQITQRVESAVRSITGVKNISSTASEGSSSTFVEFEIGTDPNEATNEVKNAVDQIRGSLPDGILEPQVEKVDVAGGFIGVFAVEANDMTVEQLSWFVDDTVSKRLLAIDGMAEVNRFGGVDREIVVTLDPAKMRALGVTASQVNSVLRQVNVNAAGGRADIGGTRQSLRVLGDSDTAFQLSGLMINLGSRGTVRLGDVAKVEDKYAERDTISRVKGKEVVNFSMSRAKGASDVAVFDEATKIMRGIEEEYPGVRFIELNTSVEYTRGQYHSSMSAMIEGAVLAVVVVFFFLRDWRATVISAVAIPLSAIPTFWFMDLLGFNLNFLSLLALGLVAGVLVDDAIVEIENIVRHMRMGKTAYQASIDAADEIGLAVVATSFCIVAVFMPVGMMPGIAGQFFKSFGLTVVAAVLTSLAVARMITPMMAAYLLKSHGHASHGEGRLMDLYMKVLHWTMDTEKAAAYRSRLTRVPKRGVYFAIPAVLGFLAMAGSVLFGGGGAEDVQEPVTLFGTIGQVFLSFFTAFIPVFLIASLLMILVGLVYGMFAGRDKNRWTAWTRYVGSRMAARLRDHRVWMVGIGAAAFAFTLFLFTVIPFQFQPEVDTDRIRVQIDMVPGTTLERTAEVTAQVSNIIWEQPDTLRVLERAREGNGTLYGALKADRSMPSSEFQRTVTPLLQNIPDARVSFVDPDSGGGGGQGRDIAILLAGSDPDLLEKTSAKLVEQMKGLPTLVAPRASTDLRRPEIQIKPRDEVAADLGVTTAAISQTIRIATIGEIEQNAAKFSLSDRQIPIRVTLPPESRRDITTISNLPVQTASGGSVPLSRVAEISFGSGPTSIERYNLQRRVIIGVDLAEGVIQGDAMKQINNLPIMKNLPDGVTNPPFGEQEWQGEMITSFVIAVISGVLLVFAVLVLLYKRLMSPLVNMSSLALAPLGGMLGLLIVGQPISMPVLIGILMLLGIVSKNSILLIDFAIEEMHTGKSKFDAIMEAGHKRAQPIVMTTVAMTAGMVPTALSLSGDAAFRAPMGTVVIGGLIMSTLLTLLIVPAGFSLADGIEKRVGPYLARKFLTSGMHDRVSKQSGDGTGSSGPGGLEPAE